MKCTKENAAMVGNHGMAWQHDLDAIKKKYPDGAPKELRRAAGIHLAAPAAAAWLVHAPWAHLFWSNYAVLVLRLHHVDNWPDAKIMLKGATHEIIVAALDPAVGIDTEDAPIYLWPLNYVGQIIASDEEAIARCEAAVREIVDGQLSPDTDFISQWVERFGDSNLRK